MKKNTAALQRAMTEKRESWQNKQWHGKAKSRWQQTAGEYGGQSSHDTWKFSRLKASGKRSLLRLMQWEPQ